MRIRTPESTANINRRVRRFRAKKKALSLLRAGYPALMLYRAQDARHLRRSDWIPLADFELFLDGMTGSEAIRQLGRVAETMTTVIDGRRVTLIRPKA